MLRKLILLVLAILYLAEPVSAQSRAAIQQKINESTAYSNQADYFMCVSRISEACSMLRANPAAMADTTYQAVATKVIDDLNKKTRDAINNNDIPNTTRLVYAMQPLVDKLITWDPGNPRWHYQKGMLFRTSSKTRNDQYPGELQSAIKEFKTTLTMPGNAQYRTGAQQMLNVCEKTLARRQVEIADFKKTHPEHNYDNWARPSGTASNFCVNCGREFTSGPWRCPYCGS